MGLSPLVASSPLEIIMLPRGWPFLVECGRTWAFEWSSLHYSFH